jgi:membrane fusion protein (multidrug efflux system)
MTDVTQHTPEAAGPSPRRQRLRRPLFALGIVVVAAGSAYFYLRGERYAGTDDAYVKATQVRISPEVGGRVLRIAVHENAQVKTGEPLLQIGSRAYRIALAQAEANVDNVVRQIAALRATHGQRAADLSQAHVDVDYYQRELKRQEDLVVRGFTSRTAYDEAEHKLAAARKGAEATVQSMRQVAAILSGDVNTPLERIPMYQQATTQRDQAQMNLDRTQVRAPMDGVVTQVEDLGPGDVVNAGQALFSLVDVEHPWVEANLKETDLTHVRIGQEATVRVDSYPGVVWHATVQGISPATGSEFSMLPPQNASGNWVKVVQRVAVRLAIDPHEHAEPLRAGLSAAVRIDTGRYRWLPG